MLLDADFDVKVERPAPTESSFLTIDPHGRYVAVGSRLGAVNFLNRYGRPAGRLETIQPIAHLCFLADRPLLIGAAAFGMLVGVEVMAWRGSGRLEPEIALAGPADVERRPADRERRRGDDPGELLHPRDPAVRPEGAERGVVPPGGDGVARGPRLPRPDRSRRRRSKGSWRSSTRRATSGGGRGWPGRRSPSRSTRWAGT